MQVNFGKVLVSGVVAGIVMTASEYVLNEVVLADEMAAALAAMNLPAFTAGTMAVFVAASFLVAIMAIWLYATLRGPMGPGPKTACCAGSFCWALYYFAPTVSFAAMGMFPWTPTVITLVWTAAEMCLATTAGAYFYRD